MQATLDLLRGLGVANLLSDDSARRAPLLAFWKRQLATIVTPSTTGTPPTAGNPSTTGTPPTTGNPSTIIDPSSVVTPSRTEGTPRQPTEAPWST